MRLSCKIHHTAELIFFKKFLQLWKIKQVHFFKNNLIAIDDLFDVFHMPGVSQSIDNNHLIVSTDSLASKRTADKPRSPRHHNDFSHPFWSLKMIARNLHFIPKSANA